MYAKALGGDGGSNPKQSTRIITDTKSKALVKKKKLQKKDTHFVLRIS